MKWKIALWDSNKVMGLNTQGEPNWKSDRAWEKEMIYLAPTSDRFYSFLPNFGVKFI